VSRQVFQNFTLDISDDWRKVPQENFSNTIPNEAVAMLIKRVEGDDFIQNLNVVKESINTDALSLEYAKANILLGSKAIIDYRPLSTREVKIGDIETTLHLFRARNSGTDPIRHFVQAYFARDRIAYTVTCISKDDDTDQQAVCEQMVRSFRLL